MSKSRRSITLDPVSEQEMRDALQDYVREHCAIQKQEAAAKAKIEKIKSELLDSTADATARMNHHQTIIARYVDEHRADFTAPNPRKREIYGGHKIGLHTSPPAVEFIKLDGKKQTEAGFIELIRDSDEFEVFVRTTESLDKEALIAERRKWGVGETDHTVHFDSQLAALGVRIVSKEKIVIDVATEPEVKP